MLEPGYDGSNNWFEPEIIEKAKGCYLGSVEGKGNVI